MYEGLTQTCMRDGLKNTGTPAGNDMRFRHYKGGIYELVCEATMEADHTPLIVYKAANGSIWCRTKNVFFEIVEVDGKRMQRFTPILSAEDKER
jgi:hypothetical protein